MRGFLFTTTAAFLLARSYGASTCSECIRAKGMTWRVLHTGNTVDVKCVPTKECTEESSSKQTVMCYSLDCGKMPDSDGKEWWYEGTRHDNRCPTDGEPIECLESDRNKCVWVNVSGKEYCMFRTFAFQQLHSVICPRTFRFLEELPEEEPSVEQPAVEGPATEQPATEQPAADEHAAEQPAVDSAGLKVSGGKGPSTCSECVAKSGYSWKVRLYDRWDDPQYTTRCVPTSECKESVSKQETTLCFPLNCGSLKKTKEIKDWWTEQTTYYKQCSPNLDVASCARDHECSYVKLKEGAVTGYCIFRQFAENFSLTDACGVKPL